MSGLPGDFWETLPLGKGVQLLVRDENGLAAFDKPAGVLSHSNEAKDEPRALLTVRYDKGAQCFGWKAADGTDRRLWLLNRLDSATSGVILVAANAKLAEAIRDHYLNKKVRKVYQALVFGSPRQNFELWHDKLAVQRSHGQIRTATAGNVPAETQFQVIKHSQKNFSTTLVRLEPRTGRSHQLRVQCAKRQLPIVGDQTYGDFQRNRAFTKGTKNKRLFLHSLETGFTYEFGGKSFEFKAAAPLPKDFTVAY